MKKHLIALFALAPVLCFGGQAYLYTFNNDLSTTENKVVFPSIPYNSLEFTNTVYSIYFNNFVGYYVGRRGFLQPNTQNSIHTNSTHSVDFQISIQSSPTIYLNPLYIYPVASLYYTVESLYQAGYRSYGLQVVSDSGFYDHYVNFNFSHIVSDILSSTNNTYQSIVLSMLNSIHSSIQGLNTSIQNINVDLGQFQTDYQNVNWDSLNFLDFVDGAISNGSFSSSHGQYLKDTYITLLANDDLLAANAFKSSVLQQFRNNNLMSNAASWLNDNANNSAVQSALRSAGDFFGAGAAFHYTTPLTNEMKRMTTDWVNETKSALSNNTQKIKDDLAAWKNQLHGTQTSIDNSAANINNTLNNIAGGSSVVRVNVQNHDIGVTITDPVTIDPTQFNAFSEDLGKAGDYMERLFNEFKWWAWDSPDSWKKGFLDRDLSRLSSNVQQQVSIQHSISNLLADFASNFTNNTEFAISNALAGFTFSSTNGYLLLSDYQSFIDSSKYNTVVSSLPDDLAAALSSFGFSDSSEYSGRWWVFQSANMALQSQLALTNAALSSTLLNALSAIDDSDDSGGSLLSRWLSLIDSIPDPEEIQQSLADATNIVSNIGFERADALYSTATQDLVSVVKGIYRDKSLPDNIRFVFIPAAQGREEKFVDIPVGEHSSLWSLFRSGMAFALSVVTLILFPKYVSWLVVHYTRLVERIIKSLHAYTHQ